MLKSKFFDVLYWPGPTSKQMVKIIQLTDLRALRRFISKPIDCAGERSAELIVFEKQEVIGSSSCQLKLA
jgi:hypothetical protein